METAAPKRRWAGIQQQSRTSCALDRGQRRAAWVPPADRWRALSSHRGRGIPDVVAPQRAR
eukprot:3055671-Lingulodinium_polyedra.AAC.1